MNAADMIEQAAVEGVVLALSLSGAIKATGDQFAVDKWLPIIRDYKPVILCELKREGRYSKVLAMLEENHFAILVEDEETDPVIATIAIRNVATFEMAIPQHSYDGMMLLELIEKHYGENNE